MKLFSVDYMDDCYDQWFLTVGESEDEVKEREAERLINKGVSLLGIFVSEISEVDGFKINLSKIRFNGGSHGIDY